MSADVQFNEGIGHGGLASASPTDSGSPAPPIPSRRCYKCGCVYPRTKQYWDTSSARPQGLSILCKPCRRQRDRTKYANLTPDRKRRLREIGRRWAKINYPKTKPLDMLRRGLRRARDPKRFRAIQFAARIRREARRFTIPVDAVFTNGDSVHRFLLTKDNCQACDRLIDYTYKPHGRNNSSPSLDRIHPDRGYVLGNVALVCWRCNSLKKDGTPEEFTRLLNWLRAVW